MAYWGEPVSPRDVARALGRPPEGGYRLDQLKAFAESRGLAAFLIEGTLEDLRRQCGRGRPCVVVYRSGPDANHSAVVVRVGNEPGESASLLLMDPAGGRFVERSYRSLRAGWESAGFPLLLVARAEAGGAAR
jgi:hypothetical protein